MKEIWVVNEDDHGDVSYWTTKEKAIEEMKRIILDLEDDGEINSELFQEDEDFICYAGCVSVKRVTLDESWFTLDETWF